MEKAFVVSGIRSAIGSFGGSLATVRPDDLAANCIRELLNKNPGVPIDAIDDVILGCANQAGEDNRNVARMSALLSGLPVTVPGETVNRLCASGLSAVVNAARAVMVKDGDLYLAGGVESMTRAPYVVSKSESAFGRNSELFDTSIGWRFVNKRMKEIYGVDSMGETAENVARQYNISRADQDSFAYNSQMKASAAQKKGRFKKEITSIPVITSKKESVNFESDEFIKPNTTLEVLGKLKPAFAKDDKGSVTAGNSSGINDGAAVLLICSESALKEFKLTPLVQIISSAVYGVEPRLMGMGPVPASQHALKKAGLKFDDLSVIELNEAFAAQSLACIREFGLKDDDPRINPNGGAIALGHPLGMSGARLILTAAHELIEKGGRFGLCTMCVGVGQGMAVVIERV